MLDDIHANALSRRATVHICPQCGTEEALEDYAESVHGSQKLPLKGWFVCKTVFGQMYQQKNADGSYSFELTRKIELRQQDIEDILTTAFEGGITDWCSRVEPVGTFDSDYASEHIAKGGEAKLYDAESSDIYTLTADMVAKGVNLWLLNEGTDPDSGVIIGTTVDTSQIDAWDADVIVQYAVFGEIIYS